MVLCSLGNAQCTGIGEKTFSPILFYIPPSPGDIPIKSGLKFRKLYAILWV